MIGDTPDDIRAGIAAGTRAIGVFTPEEYAKVVLNMVTVDDTMELSLFECGSEGMMKPGMLELLDIIKPRWMIWTVTAIQLKLVTVTSVGER